MLLSLTSKYAVQSLVTLERRSPELTSVRFIAEEAGIPLKYLGRLMPTLGRAGLVEVVRGARGGYRLAKPASKISLWSIIEAAQGTETMKRCLLGLAGCSDSADFCAIHEQWAPHRTAVFELLQRTYLSDVKGSSLDFSA